MNDIMKKINYKPPFCLNYNTTFIHILKFTTKKFVLDLF